MTVPVLVLNSGSSSLKFQLVDPESGSVGVKGTIERIGEVGSEVPDHAAAVAHLITMIDEGAPIVAVGHRVVHGGPYFSAPVLIDDPVEQQIADLIPLAPLHNPAAVAGIQAARQRFAVPHVAVFDTAFFTSLPPAAATYAIPADLAREHQIRRYGFHGTSHRYVSRAAAAFLEQDLGELNQIVLHLGNGCSASAVRGGLAVDTSMGLTPLQGLVMGTRSGDVDPSLHRFLHAELGLSVDEIDTLLNNESGLKGLAGVNDFRELEQRRSAGDEAAQLAFQVYVHRLKHYLGAYAAVLGRLDAVTFTAGVGENNPALRDAVLADLAVLGIEIDRGRNEAPSREPRMISTDESAVRVLVIPTNEELEIARQTIKVIGAVGGPPS